MRAVSDHPAIHPAVCKVHATTLCINRSRRLTVRVPFLQLDTHN
jgi:hypothetical protein